MPKEYANQLYYPGAKARLSIRFDEFQDTGPGTPKDQAMKMAKANPMTSRTTTLRGKGNVRGIAKVVDDPGAPPKIKKFLILPLSGTNPQGRPTDQPGSADGFTKQIVGIIPKTASLKLNGIRSADQLTLAIKWIDCPMDPRVIRACAVEFYLGTLRSDDFAAGAHGRSRPTAPGGFTDGTAGQPLNLIPDEWTDDHGRTRSNLRFQGWVDKWAVTFDEGEPLIKLECRDNTQLLLNQDHPPALVIDTSKRIDEAIAEILANFPQFAGLSVVYKPTSTAAADVPTVNKVLDGSSHRPDLGPPAAKGGGGSETTKVWDYLLDICGAIGHAIYVDGNDVIIQKPTSLLNGRSQPREDDPYGTGRTLLSGEYPNRPMIFGRNILSMQIDRDFARATPKNIELRAYTARKNALVARYPEKADRVVSSLPGDGRSDEKWVVKRIGYPVKSADELKNIAQQVYESQGRGEVKVKLKTKNLGSYGGDNYDPDLLDLHTGDNFQILIDPAVGYLSGPTQIQSQLQASDLGQAFLSQLGFDADFSKAYAKAYTNVGVQSIYRVRTMQMEWGVDEGVSLDIEGANYVEARVDPNATTGSTTTNSADTAHK